MKENNIVKTLRTIVLCMLLLIISLNALLPKPQENVVFASIDNIDLPVKAYYLMDYNTNKAIASSKETERLEVASMVKLMTTLLVIEKIEHNGWELSTKLLTSNYAASMEGSQAFLDAGSEYTVDDLLKSVIVASANDSCVVLAENMCGSEQNFVDLMNKRAIELNMTNTLYCNSTGLHSLTQYSCAKDIATVLSEVYKHDLYHKYATIWMDKLIHPSGRETELVNTNRLIRYYPGCDSGKTGFTDEAGYCLSASASKNGMHLISVVIGAKSSQERFESSSTLLNYGFNNYENKKMVCSDTILTETAKSKGVIDEIKVKSERDLFVLSKRNGNSNNNVQVKVIFDNNLKGAIKQNQKVGTIYLVEDGIVIDECSAIAVQDYNKFTYKDAFTKIIDNFRL